MMVLMIKQCVKIQGLNVIFPVDTVTVCEWQTNVSLLFLFGLLFLILALFFKKLLLFVCVRF